MNFWVDYNRRDGIWDRANDNQIDFLNTLPVFHWLAKLIAPPNPIRNSRYWLSWCCCVVLVRYSNEQRNVLIVSQCSHFLRTFTYCWDKRRYFSIKKLHTSPLKSSQYAKLTVAFSLCAHTVSKSACLCVLQGFRELR